MSVAPAYAAFNVDSSNVAKPPNSGGLVQRAYDAWKNISMDDQIVKLEASYGRLAMSGAKVFIVAVYLSVFSISYLTFWQNPSGTTPTGTDTIADVVASPNADPGLRLANSLMMAAISASTYLIGADIYNCVDFAVFAGLSYAALTLVRSTPFSSSMVNNFANRMWIMGCVLFAVFVAICFFVGGTSAGAGFTYWLLGGEITAMPVIVWNDFTNTRIGVYNAFYVFSRIMTVAYIKYDWGMLSTVRNFIVMSPDALEQSKNNDPNVRPPSVNAQQSMQLAIAMGLITFINNMATYEVLGYQVDPSTPFVIGIITGSPQGLGIRALGWTVGTCTAVLVWIFIIVANNYWLASKANKKTKQTV